MNSGYDVQHRYVEAVKFPLLDYTGTSRRSIARSKLTFSSGDMRLLFSVFACFVLLVALECTDVISPFGGH